VKASVICCRYDPFSNQKVRKNRLNPFYEGVISGGQDWRSRMEKIIHARRLACPDPANRATKTLKQEREIVVIVDNDIAAAMASAGRLVVP